MRACFEQSVTIMVEVVTSQRTELVQENEGDWELVMLEFEVTLKLSLVGKKNVFIIPNIIISTCTCHIRVNIKFC